VPGVDYEQIEQVITAEYRAASAQYRSDDEIEVLSENHQRLCHVLRRICRSIPGPLSVLDVGCGTGRHFHCLENVAHLTGSDICEEMLAAARVPVRAEQVTAQNIELIRGNIYLQNFAPGSFDVIYSLGMFGHGCPVTVELCDKFHDWLKPGGKLFFNVVDFDGLPLWYRARRGFRDMAYPLVGRRLRAVLDKREQRSPFFGLTGRQLKRIISRTRFASDFTVTSQVCNSPLWTGRHLECLAAKADSSRKAQNFRAD
jgi:SAM-dependent methyltransferase